MHGTYTTLGYQGGIKEVSSAGCCNWEVSGSTQENSWFPKAFGGSSRCVLHAEKPYKIPELDVQTRSNSTWEMMSGVVSLRRALEELLHKIYKRHEGFCQFIIGPNDDLAKPISEQTWYAMEDCCNFLLPFKQATVLLSGSDYPTLGKAMPVFTSLPITSKSQSQLTLVSGQLTRSNLQHLCSKN